MQTSNDAARSARIPRLIASCTFAALLLVTSGMPPTASAQEMRERPSFGHHGGNGGGRGFRSGVGIGVGIGSMLIDQISRQQRSEPVDEPVRSSTKRVSKKKGGSHTAKKKKGGSSTAKKKDNTPELTTAKDTPAPVPKPPEVPVTPRKPPNLVTYPLPENPAHKCDECLGYWREALRYNVIIKEKLDRLARNEKELRDLQQQRERLVDRMKSAKGSIQKAHYRQQIKNADEHIELLRDHNNRMGELITQEDENLARWVKAYEECAAKLCPKITSVPVAPQAPAAPPTQVAKVPEDTTPGSTPRKSKCPDHYAELTNIKRVFHRLYIRGTPQESLLTWGFVERLSWKSQYDKIKDTLEDDRRQAPGSSSRTFEIPTLAEVKAAIKALQLRAKPCEEVTIYIKGHGEAIKSPYMIKRNGKSSKIGRKRASC